MTRGRKEEMMNGSRALPKLLSPPALPTMNTSFLIMRERSQKIPGPVSHHVLLPILQRPPSFNPLFELYSAIDIKWEMMRCKECGDPRRGGLQKWPQFSGLLKQILFNSRLLSNASVSVWLLVWWRMTFSTRIIRNLCYGRCFFCKWLARKTSLVTELTHASVQKGRGLKFSITSFDNFHDFISAFFLVVKKKLTQKRDQNFIDTYPHCPVRLGTNDRKKGGSQKTEHKRTANWIEVSGSLWVVY